MMEKSLRIKRKGGGNIFGLPLPPSPREVKEALDEVVEGVTGLKEIPKALLELIPEAEKDFKEADRALKGARFRGKRKKP